MARLALPRLVVVVLLLLVMVMERASAAGGGARLNEGGVAVAASSRDGAVVLQTLSRRLKTKIAALAPASKVRESITEAMGDLRQGDVVLLEKADEADSKAVAAAARTPPDLEVAAREQEKATGLRRDAAARKARGLRAFESLASILSLVEEASQFAELLSLEVDKHIELESFSEANLLSKGLTELRSQIKTLQQSDEYRAVQAQLHRDEEEGATDEQGAGGDASSTASSAGAMCESLPKPRLLSDAEQLILARESDSEEQVQMRFDEVGALREKINTELPGMQRKSARRAESKRAEATKTAAEARTKAKGRSMDEARDLRQRSKDLEEEAGQSDKESLRIGAVILNAKDDLDAAEAALALPEEVAGQCEEEAGRLREEAGALIAADAFEEADPLLTLADKFDAAARDLKRLLVVRWSSIVEEREQKRQRERQQKERKRERERQKKAQDRERERQQKAQELRERQQREQRELLMRVGAALVTILLAWELHRWNTARNARKLKDAGKNLKELGFSANFLKAWGFSAKDLKEAGFSCKQLKEGAFTGKELVKSKSFSTSELLQALKKGHQFVEGDPSNKVGQVVFAEDDPGQRRAKDVGEHLKWESNRHPPGGYGTRIVNFF